jgi:hypothetical protein
MGLPGNKHKFEESIDEMVSSLCAGAISMHVARIDTKTKHQDKSIYEADRTYFRTTKQRAFIRESYCGEFDYSPSSSLNVVTYPTLIYQNVPKPNELLKSLWKFIPKLWLIVTDYGEGVHHVTTIYRGDAMWAVEDREGIDTAILKTPADLSEALSKIQQCEGTDEPSFVRFCKRYWDACVFEAAVIDTKGMAIN